MPSRTIITLLLLIILQNASAQNTQDTFHLDDPAQTKYLWENNSYYLLNKNIFYDDSENKFPYELLRVNPRTNKSSCALYIPEAVQIDHCVFCPVSNHGFGDSCDRREKLLTLGKDLIITNCRFLNSPYFSLNADAFLFYGNETNHFLLNSCHFGSVQCGNNYFHSNPVISSINMNFLKMDSNRFENDIANYFVTNCSTHGVSIYDFDKTVTWYGFNNDTISIIFEFSPVSAESGSVKGSAKVTFDRCQMDCRFAIENINPGYKTTLQFRACQFNAKTSLLSVSADTIEFSDCLNISNPIPISVDKSREILWLKLKNTNPANIKFDYLGKIRLFLWGDKETDVSNYENLIAKFENEKKEESLQNIRIEFYKYSHSPVRNFLSAIWWYYGFQRFLILLWTLGSLIVFYLINFKNWEKMTALYPIMENDRPSYDEFAQRTRLNKWKKRVKVLAFTVLIFFSLRIDFDKLSFQKPGFVVYFFFQYLVGLGCLFFILNAILKI